ncbi:hypothetical protein Clacol_001660 [Clathrus columnatus]|uniref:RFX-type winged-helix domain-containing protein n=1 Tax=Clathrus columnatus TaxID=1419009 RepID=A0AAV5A1U2_9AGAM|nr:hypothetical protein Clacol_001660 [Clathrus columnatus]
MSVMAPIDYHSRSASVSSNSSSSRPSSAHEGLYHAQFTNSSTSNYTHSRHSSSASTKYSLASTTIITPADSPPNGIPALKNQLAVRTPHLRHAARAAASPYARDAHSQSGSEAEQDDLALYLSSSTSQQSHQPPPPQHTQSAHHHQQQQQHSPDYPGLYIASQMPPHQASHHSHHHHSIHQPQHSQHGHHPHSQDAAAAAASFGRMSLSADMTLEHLASNVRSATTTSASDRAKQIFVQAWLSANYATYPDGNVPRQGLYFSYRRICEQYQIPHINTATLGKAIRLCFPTIKTRRLGVRDCGIRPATTTEAEWLQEYIRRTNNHAGLSSTTLPVRPSNSLQNNSQHSYTREGSRSDPEDDDDDGVNSEGASSSNGHSKNFSNPLRTNKAAPTTSLTLPVKSPTLCSMDISDKTPTAHSLQHQVCTRPDSGTYGPTPAQIRRRSQGPPVPVSNQLASSSTPPQIQNGVSSMQILGHHSASVRSLLNFPSIEDALGSNSSSPQGLLAREVWQWFEEHLDSLLDSVKTFRFDQFELNIRSFWSNLSVDHKEVVHAPAVAGLMARADALVYDEILEILRSQILSPIPPHILTSLRQLADKMEKILLLALENYGPTFVEPKVELGARFGHLVAQALSTVLSNPKQLADMRQSWSNIDFESVRNQAALVCNCRHEDLVQLLEVDFVKLMDSLLTMSEPVRIVTVWADECCERLMGGGLGINGSGRGVGMGVEDRGSTMSSRSVLIRWGYVTSQIMRDLTIRSDPAFGAFQILKLFLDDWIALNVLRSVALSTNSVQASVEPVVQQAFFSLSPIAGQDTFSHSLDRPTSHHGSTGSDGHDGGNGSSHHASHLHMSHTPTTSSMLAVLNDPFPSSNLDSGSGSFNPSSYTAGLSYMDTSPTHHSTGTGSAAFGDFVSASDSTFGVDVGMEVGVVEVDVSSFTSSRDLSGIGTTASSSSTVGNSNNSTGLTSGSSALDNAVKKEGTQ